MPVFRHHLRLFSHHRQALLNWQHVLLDLFREMLVCSMIPFISIMSAPIIDIGVIESEQHSDVAKVCASISCIETHFNAGL